MIATRPATAPDAAPRVVAWPLRIFSTINQVSMAAAGAKIVLAMAWAATPLAARAEPALKPVQPNQRMPVPRIVNGRLWGGIGVSG